MQRPTLFRICGAALLGVLALAACAGDAPPPSGTAQGGTGPAVGDGQAAFGNFPDIALPAGTAIDLDRSLVLGAGRDWVGRLAFTTRSGGVAEIYAFFRAEMPRLGWTETTSLRGATSLLVFQQGQRVATIQISGRHFALGGGAAVEIVMAPRGSGVGGGGGFGTGGGIEQAPLPPPRR